MLIEIECTNEIEEVVYERETGARAKARVWAGTTESGMPVRFFVVCVRPAEPDADVFAFMRDMRELCPRIPDVVTRVDPDEFDGYTVKIDGDEEE